MSKQEISIDLQAAYQEYQRLPLQFNSLLMATVSDSGIPNASYAAYIKDQGDYYVFISELATHTENIIKTRQVSVLFIENEQQAQHLFARQRVTQFCDANEVNRDTDNYQHIMLLFSQKFGKFMKLLEDKQDFHLFCLHPIQGSYVAGFGRAFTIKGDDIKQMHHINDAGHKTSPNHTDQQETVKA